MARLSLRALLSLVFGGLVLLTAAVTLAIVVTASGDAAFGDAIDKGRQTQKVLSERLAAELRRVEAAAALLARRSVDATDAAIAVDLAALVPAAAVLDEASLPGGWSLADGRPAFRPPGARFGVAVDLGALEATMSAMGREGVAGVLLSGGRVLARTRSGGRIDEADDAALEALFAVPLPPDEVVEDAPTLQRVRRDTDEPVFLSSAPLPTPGLDLRVGFATTPSTVGDAIEQIAVASLVALGVALLAVVLALLIARRIARAVSGVRDALDRIAALDLDAVEPIPAMPARELEDIRRALARAVLSLRAFGLFVPKTLVQRLLERGDGSLRLAEERDVTVLFTDIVGFTALASQMRPAEVTGVLDRHFAMVTEAVEAEGGTVDKYVGDGILAYWGAPEPSEDHAARAWAAATRIQEAHRRAMEEGTVRFGLRIGFHSGPVIAGTVGTGERLDYTIVGDTVNVASRLEQLGREVDPDCPCCALASGDVVARAGLRNGRSLGRRALRGRDGEVEVFRLPDAPDAPDPDAAGSRKAGSVSGKTSDAREASADPAPAAAPAERRPEGSTA